MNKFVNGLLIFIASSSLAFSQDWAQWRGENRDGVLATSEIPKIWPKELNKMWEVEIGTGHATPLVVANHIYTFARKNDLEGVSKIDAKSGKMIWEKSYSAPYEMNRYARGHGKGPKSTPVISGNKMIALGISGILSCYDIQNGKQLWQLKFDKKHDTTSPIFGTAMSPLVRDDMVLAHVGGEDDGAFTAFNLEDGKEIWKWTGDGPAYASPIIYEESGAKQVVTFSQKNIIGIDLKSGKLLWQIPFITPYGGESSVTPIIYKNDLIFSGVGKGIMRISLAEKNGKWTTKEVWKNEGTGSYMSSPVLFDDIIALFSDKRKGVLATISPETGDVLWQGEGRSGENAAIIRSGNFILVLTNDGKLTIGKREGTGFSVIKQYETADSETWAHPVFFDRKLLIKDKDKLTLWSLDESS